MRPERSRARTIVADTVWMTDNAAMRGDWKSGLLAREPIFDRPEYIWDEASFEAEIAADFREIGASGACYERDVIKAVVLGRLRGSHPLSLSGGYRIDDATVHVLGTDIAHVRYTLHAQGRVTRRSTLYRSIGSRWQAVFHQGTVVADASPLPPKNLDT